MRIILPLTLIAAGVAALSSLALAGGSKSTDSCSEPRVVEPAVESCAASERLCENWLKGRAVYRATFSNSGRTCG
jgi:hypothetical protein